MSPLSPSLCASRGPWGRAGRASASCASRAGPCVGLQRQSCEEAAKATTKMAKSIYIYISMYICTYIYAYIYISVYLSLSIYIGMYIDICKKTGRLSSDVEFVAGWSVFRFAEAKLRRSGEG